MFYVSVKLFQFDFSFVQLFRQKVASSQENLSSGIENKQGSNQPSKLH